MPRQFLSLTNEPFTLDIPPPSANDSVFVLAPHKAGSVLLFGIVQSLADAAGRAAVDFTGQAYVQGVVDVDFPLEALMLAEEPGYIFIGNRSPTPLLFVRSYRTSRKILLVRDPRDIAVSAYFSFRGSHFMPDTGRAADELKMLRAESARVDIETFLKQRHIDGIFENMRAFGRQISDLPNFRVFRYEEIIFDKEWFAAELAAELQIDLPEHIIKKIAARHDIRPTEERPDEHIRQVTPGNYKRYLNDAARERLETLYDDVFAAFGYSTGE